MKVKKKGKGGKTKSTVEYYCRRRTVESQGKEKGGKNKIHS